MNEKEKIKLLKEFLNIFWLRPENAYTSVLRSMTLEKYPFSAPAIDISCGDGIFTFITMGGQFDLDFDMFLDVANLDKVRTENKDMFNSYNQKLYNPIVIKRPLHKIEYGTDLMQNTLNKAEKLGVYKKCLLHDSNKKMPFDDNSFMTVYSNSLYYVKNVDAHLKDVKRIVKSEGKVLFHVKTDKMIDYTLGHYAPFLGKKAAKIINRGRLETYKTLKSFEWWKKAFEKSGFEIVNTDGFMGKIHSYAWDVGLRPIAPFLVKMANNLDKKQRKSLKKEWMECWLDLLTPLINIKPKTSEECAEFLFVLKKKK